MFPCEDLTASILADFYRRSVEHAEFTVRLEVFQPETVHSSEKFVNIYQTTRRHILAQSSLHNESGSNFKPQLLLRNVDFSTVPSHNFQHELFSTMKAKAAWRLRTETERRHCVC
jgi:hypothetical protein